MQEQKALSMKLTIMEKRILKELNEHRSKSHENISFDVIDEANLFALQAVIIGPTSSPYSGGKFILDIACTKDYPFKPPRIKFKTKIYHPNINDRGSMSIAIMDCGWSPALTIYNILESIYALMAEPDPDSPLMADIAIEYKYDRPLYEINAREWTRKFAV